MRRWAVLTCGVGVMARPFWYWTNHPWLSEMEILIKFWEWWLAAVLIMIGSLLAMSIIEESEENNGH